jgi:type I restriction enzyme, S subunit
MAGEWRETTLGDVVRLQRGHDLPDAARRVGTVPVMGSFGLTGWHDEARATGPGVAVGRSGASIGVVSFVREDYWPLNTCLYVTDFRGNDPRFCFYWLGTLGLARYNSGSAQPSLNRNYIYDLPVRIPDPDQQRAIAHILGTLDDKIELNRRMNETLEAIARVLFKSWFVDFDPARAKAEARDPGLPKPLADLFPTRLVDSQLGEIPDGWAVNDIDSLCQSITSGGTPPRMSPAFWENGTVPWFKTGELLDGPLIESEEHVTEAALESSSCKLWPAGTILFALYASPTVGRLGILTRPGTSNQAAAGLIAKPAFGVPFLRRVLIEARTKLQTIAVGAAQQNINQGVLKSHRVVVPSVEVAAVFSRILAPLDTRQVAIAEASRTLAALRDTLLPKLISGEVRLMKAESSTQETTA